MHSPKENLQNLQCELSAISDQSPEGEPGFLKKKRGAATELKKKLEDLVKIPDSVDIATLNELQEKVSNLVKALVTKGGQGL